MADPNWFPDLHGIVEKVQHHSNGIVIFFGALGQPFKALVDAIGGWSTPIALVIGAMASGVYWAWQQQEIIHQLQKDVSALMVNTPVDQERCRNLQVSFGALDAHLKELSDRVGRVQQQVDPLRDRLGRIEAEATLHERKDEDRFRRGDNVKEIFRKGWKK